MSEAHDPTRSASPVPRHAARFSRSEIEAVCTKAARGAGLPWGLAEEAGMAARRLAEASLPGPEWLLAYLEGAAGAAPAVLGARWQTADGGVLCPIITGAALSDRAGALPACVTLDKVAHPGLLLPFVSLAAPLGGALKLSWEGGEAVASEEGIEAPDAMPVMGEVTITPTTAEPRPWSESGRRVPLDIWRRLNALLLATTVPASDASRAGAGAGTTDND